MTDGAATISEEQAIRLLQQTQLCSAYFKDFDFKQLIDLAHQLQIIEFQKDDTVFIQGEPATFFGVLLRGSLKPMAGGQQVGAARVVGELLGEMALFEGGTRTASLIANEEGYLAAFQFSQLERLKGTNPELAQKMNYQLAYATLAKKYETKGVALTQLSDAEIQAEINKLLEQQAAQRWDRLAEGESEESLLRRGASKNVVRTSAMKPSRERSSLRNRESSARPTSIASPGRDEERFVGWSTLESEVPLNERLEMVQTLQSMLREGSQDSSSSWMGVLTPEQVRDLAAAMAVVSYAVGETVFVQNETPMCAGLLLTGSVGEIVSGQLLVKKAGMFVGEEALFTGVPRRGHVVGIEDGLLALIAYADVEKLQQRSAQVGNKLVEAMARAVDTETVPEDLSRSMSGSISHDDIKDLMRRQASLGWSRRDLALETICCTAQAKAKTRAEAVRGGPSTEGGPEGPARNVLPSHITAPRALSLLCDCERLGPWLTDQMNLRELAALSKYLAVVQFAPGHVMMRQGQVATFAMLVLEGELEMHVNGRPIRTFGKGVACGYGAMFQGGEREADVIGSTQGFVAVISFSELQLLTSVQHAGAIKLAHLMARCMYAHIREDKLLGVGELSSDLVSVPSISLTSDSLRTIMEEFTARNWLSKSHLLTQPNAESLYLRVKYHQIDTYAPEQAQRQDFTVRVLYPDGSSVMHTFTPQHSVEAALEKASRELSAASLPAQATGGGTIEWVLQVPTTGEVLKASNEPLASAENVQTYLNYRRTPLLRLCTLQDAEEYQANNDSGEDTHVAVVHQILGPAHSWSSESEEVIEFRRSMRQIRPTAQAEYQALLVSRKLPMFRDSAPPMKSLPQKFKVIIYFQAPPNDITKALIASRGQLASELRDSAHVQYTRTLKAATLKSEEMVLKVVGLNEYIDEGEVMDYVYIRKCLKQGKDIYLALVPHPNLDLPPLPPPPPPPPPPPAPSRQPETLNVWDLSPRACLRVRIVSVENLRSFSDLLRKKSSMINWSVYVRVGVYNGGKLLHSVQETPLLTCDDACNPQWCTWLGKKESGDTPLAWVSMQLFNHKDQLVTGSHSQRMWPNGEANPIGCNQENLSNYGSEPPVLFVEFDSYVLPVVIPSQGVDHISKRVKMGPQPNEDELIRIKRIVEQDPLAPIGEAEKKLVWRYKHFILTCAEALPKFLQCVPWEDYRQVEEMHTTLAAWSPLKPTAALELLDAKFADMHIRNYAVSRLEDMTDAELADYVLQLVQVLKYESRHDSALARFLLRRALSCPHQVAHQFFWCLKAEMHVPEVSERFGLYIEEYLRCCGPNRSQVQLQFQVEQQLISAAELVKTLPKSQRIEELRKELRKIDFPPRFQLPLDPRFECSGLKVDKCKCMSSKKVPLWLVFLNADPCGKDLYVMFKCGDDLRQDALTLQIIRIMERTWESEGLDLRLSPYACVATGDEIGFLEIVLNSDTTANITKKYAGGAAGAFSKEPMAMFLRENAATESQYQESVETFGLSLAGYCVATYIMGIGDRHNDNVMLSKQGHLFHIDFGHFLGNFKSKFGIKRERAPFVMTPDFAYVLGDKGSEKFEQFVGHCCQAYSIMRKHSHMLITLFSLMLSTGIPELQKAEDIDWLRECLMVDKPADEADELSDEHFTKLIYTSLATRTTQFNNAVHILAHSK